MFPKMQPAKVRSRVQIRLVGNNYELNYQLFAFNYSLIFREINLFP